MSPKKDLWSCRERMI